MHDDANEIRAKLEQYHQTFLERPHLRDTWKNNTKTHFSVGEIGFNSGLNFLATWRQWQQTAANNARLDYICVEANPPNRSELRQALALWPELSQYTNELLENYPALLHSGFHRLLFDDRQVSFTLIVNSPSAGLEQLQQSAHPLFANPLCAIDTWYYKSISASEEAGADSEALLMTMAKLSHPNSILISDNADASTQDQLSLAGFEVCKLETARLCAKLKELPPRAKREDFVEGAYNAPFAPPWNVSLRDKEAPSAPKTVTVIGGGIAGCHSARALALKGYEVTLIEQEPELASQGSGNPQGVLYGKLSPREETLAEFNISALAFGQRAYSALWSSSEAFGEQCGVLQLAHTAKEQKLHEALRVRYGEDSELVQFLSPAQASEIAGIDIPHSGLFFPEAGWVNPKVLCQHLAEHPQITIKRSTQVSELTRTGNQWQALDKQGGILASSSSLLIATAGHAQYFSQTQHLPLKPVRGQVTYLAASEASRKLKTALCSEGYIAPADPLSNSHCIGATFDVKAPFYPEGTNTQQSDHLENLDKMDGPTPALEGALGLAQHRSESEKLSGRAAYRCTTPDYLPIAGPAPKYANFLEDYQLLRKNAKSSIPRAGNYWPGLYLNIGHGSRGLTYAALTAELLAAQIDGTTPPLPRHLIQALSPARFIIRDLIRKKI